MKPKDEEVISDFLSSILLEVADLCKNGAHEEH